MTMKMTRMSKPILVRCKSALRNAFLANNGTTWGGRYKDYASSVETNLLPVPTFELCQGDFKSAKGHELVGRQAQPPKMAAIFSSSALAVNSFAPWREDPSGLQLGDDSAFITLRFEASCPNGLRQFSPLATDPHLDVLLTSPTRVLGVESKCLEHLSPKAIKFSPTYDRINDRRAQSAWFLAITRLRSSKEFKYLDVAQLIKHGLGLLYTYSNNDEKAIALVYLFWEPVNWQQFDTFKRHREETEVFRKLLEDDIVSFKAQSYLELWGQWEGQVYTRGAARPPKTAV
jgi:hypothetical protein